MWSLLNPSERQSCLPHIIVFFHSVTNNGSERIHKTRSNANTMISVPIMAPKVWLITGCTSGFGAEIAKAALAHGDKVVATARDPSRLTDLASAGALTERIDVTESDEILKKTIDKIVGQTGTIDILVNNAGYILAGGVEECSRAEIEAQFNTNVFGQLNMIRAVLPVMRAQKSGVVANLGSIGGWHGTPAAGLYCASKACSTILAESLRQEVAHLGIRVTAIEPGYFRTNFLSGGHKVTAANVIEDLKPGTGATHAALEGYDHKQPGDPAKGAQVIVEALTGTGRCKGVELPPRLPIGADAYVVINQYMDGHRESMAQRKDLITSTNHDDS